MDNHTIDDEREKLRIENELRKAKMILEHGAIFSESSDNKTLPPLIENEFLKSIEAFENAYWDTEKVLLYDFIECPDFIPVHYVPDLQISAELERIMNILNKNGIQLDTLCDVDEHEIYRFITEELFSHEMDNMRIPGMMNCFIYEEFHPNLEYDIRNHSIDGVKSFMNKKADFYTSFFTREAMEDTRLKHFRDAFKSFSLKHFEITNLTFDEEKAFVSFNIDFTGKIEGSSEKQHFAGEGSIELIYLYDYLCIQKINFPEAASSK
jgi:hypothetical protein